MTQSVHESIPKLRPQANANVVLGVYSIRSKLNRTDLITSQVEVVMQEVLKYVYVLVHDTHHLRLDDKCLFQKPIGQPELPLGLPVSSGQSLAFVP